MREAELLEDAGDSWVAVIRGLPDNPLAQYLQLLRRRRAERAGAKRSWPFWAGLLSLFAWAGFAALGGPAGLFLLAVPLAWLAEGLFVAAMDCQLLLSSVREKGGYVVDDMLASSRLSDREILAAALSVFLPPLWLRLGVFMLLGWLMLNSELGGQHYGIASPYLDQLARSRPQGGLFYDWEAFYGISERPLSPAAMAGFELARLVSLKRFPLALNLAAYTLPPSTFKQAYLLLCMLFIAAGAFISSLTLVLSFLCCGRGQRGRLLPIFSSVVICLAVIGYAWLSWRELNLGASLGLQQYTSPPPLILAASICVVLSSFVLCINLARDLPALRGGLWFILPVWGAAGYLACQLASGGSLYGYNAVSQDIGSAYLWAWGALFPLNALAIPPHLAWPLQLSYGPPPDSEWLRWPLLAGLQLLLLLASLGGALEALHFRRSHDG